jgi:predicted GNAT family acetyltransferase
MTVTDHPERSRFELEEQGEVAFARYRREDGTLVIAHVEAPPRLRGTGAAGRLMQGVVEAAQAEGLRIVPLCGYAATWLRRHKA